MVNNLNNSLKKFLKSKRIKYIDLDNLSKITHKKPDFIIFKNNKRLIVELKEISYTKKEVSQFNIRNNLIKLILFRNLWQRRLN